MLREAVTLIGGKARERGLRRRRPVDRARHRRDRASTSFPSARSRIRRRCWISASTSSPHPASPTPGNPVKFCRSAGAQLDFAALEGHLVTAAIFAAGTAVGWPDDVRIGHARHRHLGHHRNRIRHSGCDLRRLEEPGRLRVDGLGFPRAAASIIFLLLSPKRQGPRPRRPSLDEEDRLSGCGSKLALTVRCVGFDRRPRGCVASRRCCSAAHARRRLRGGEARDRHAEGRARHVVEPARSQKAIDAGSPPCSPQMPTLSSGLHAAAALGADAHQLADAVVVDRDERVDLEDAAGRRSSPGSGAASSR